MRRIVEVMSGTVAAVIVGVGLVLLVVAALMALAWPLLLLGMISATTGYFRVAGGIALAGGVLIAAGTAPFMAAARWRRPSA